MILALRHGGRPAFVGASTRPGAAVVLVAALLFAACAREAPLDSKALQARNAEDARSFAAKVAAEPPSDRLAVERVARTILIAPEEQVVYVLDPDLVAVDAMTGSERWRATEVRGTDLGRAGRYLVATTEPAPEVPALHPPHATIAWVDPSAPTKRATCSVAPPAPPAAQETELFPFDRAGALHLYWRSRLKPWSGGTPPPGGHDTSMQAAEGCGVLAFDAATCAVRPAEIPGYDRSHCSPNSPTIVIPAVAASAAPSYAGKNPALRVDVEHTRKDCEGRTTRILRATDGDRVLWSRDLTDLVTRCGPP